MANGFARGLRGGGGEGRPGHCPRTGPGASPRARRTAVSLPLPPAGLRHLGDRRLGSRDGAARSFLPVRLPVCEETPLRAPTFCARRPGGARPGTRPQASPATLQELGDRTLPKLGDRVAQNPGENRGSKGGRNLRRRAPRLESETALRSRARTLGLPASLGQRLPALRRARPKLSC